MTQKYFNPSHLDHNILISVINKDQSYSYSYMVCGFENHGGRIYIPMSLLECLFYTNFSYDEDVNRLTVWTWDLNETKQQLAKNLWGWGKQTRSGAAKALSAKN